MGMFDSFMEGMEKGFSPGGSINSQEEVVVSKRQAKEVGNKLGVDWKEVNLSEFHKGMNEELEHRDVTHGDYIMTGKIALVHLEEDSRYYTKLQSTFRKR